ncbi:MAG: N-acetyltransferase [Anaerolineales bacterium]|nr:N-acetyltransferase [Anaerolineales bacterium]
MSTLLAFPIEPAHLNDGTPVQLRSLRPDDVERIKAFFYRLSPESIFYRLLEYRTTITDAEAKLLCDVDGVHRVAIAATQFTEAGEENIVAVARYALVNPETPEVAEAAIVVEDGLQGRGLGTLLIRRLVRYAREHGIRRFVATVHYNNARILRFIEHSGLPVERVMEHGIWNLFIHIDAANLHLN